MTPSEALTGIISLVGAGGVTSIVVGFLAFKTEAAKGRRKPLEPADIRDTNGAVPGSHDVELLANAASQVAAALGRLNILAEFHLCQGQSDPDAFKDWLEKRDLEEALAAFRAEHRR